MHRLNVAAGEINKQLSERNFKAATTYVFGFLSNELCDVFIVSRGDEFSFTIVSKDAVL
jgi:valyl-tRNA synthetase